MNDDYDNTEMTPCQMCGRNTVGFLGQLGKVLWGICRGCGWQQPIEREEEEGTGA